jgi:quercetin dioxygenase-like cupin family protein
METILSNRTFCIALATALVAAAGPASIAQGDPGMEITRKADRQSIEGPSEYFTGQATITGMFSRDDPSRLTGAIVHFEPGARTAWHSHPLGQTLIVTEGVGWTQVEGGPKYEFEAGDIMWCPPDRKHWHGATPHEAMTHIALQEALDGENVTWMEHVTDEEYLAETGDD